MHGAHVFCSGESAIQSLFNLRERFNSFQIVNEIDVDFTSIALASALQYNTQLLVFKSLMHLD